MDAEHVETLEMQDDVSFEPTRAMALEMCLHGGHMPTRVVADNGFTYDWICARCGESLT